jgi:ceramide glucosyltransferase
MSRFLIAYCVLFFAALPFIYYVLSFYSSWNFFRSVPDRERPDPDFLPPVSNLKPIRGLDPEAYENFASLCRQDYPEYELLFCVGSDDKAIIPVLEKLALDFPERKIRILFGSGRTGSNDKVAKLARLVDEAQHEILVINDSDVRVRPDYLRTVVAPLAKAHIGAVTCLYVSAFDRTFADRLQSVGMLSDFFPGIFVARQLDGIKFALGTTIATTRSNLAAFGGYAALENRPADDLLVGRLIADGGHEVVLLPYAVETVPDYSSVNELWHKRLRWTVVMRHMRPWGHLGLSLTFGLPWTLLAIIVRPTGTVITTYLGAYLLLRVLMTWIVTVWGLKRRNFWRQAPLIVAWDAFAFALWIASFFRSSIKWRNGEYYIRNGSLVPVMLKETAAGLTSLKP